MMKIGLGNDFFQEARSGFGVGPQGGIKVRF